MRGSPPLGIATVVLRLLLFYGLTMVMSMKISRGEENADDYMTSGHPYGISGPIHYGLNRPVRRGPVGRWRPEQPAPAARGDAPGDPLHRPLLRHDHRLSLLLVFGGALWGCLVFPAIGLMLFGFFGPKRA